MTETVGQTYPELGFWVLLGLFLMWGIAWGNLEKARYFLDGRLAGAHTMNNFLLNARLIADAEQQRLYISLLTGLVSYNYQKQAEETATLQEELQQAAALVAMHNLSHGSQVRFEPDSGLDALEMAIPPFTLLCLVENALAHGMDAAHGSGCIRISSGLKKGKMRALYLSGYGMPQARILKRPPKGHGLHYLCQRLHRFCADRSSHHDYRKPFVQGDKLIIQIPV
jgi:LytS/YehU family sensor histidine kinase